MLRVAVLHLRPVSELQRLDADWWRAAQGPIRFELDPGAQPFPQGWVLLQGRLSRPILDGTAKLVAYTDRAELSLDVPVSMGGFVFELVKLPPAVRRLVWQPSQLSGTFEHTPLTARKVGLLRRHWLMTRRVAAFAWREPRETKRRAGLRWWRAWHDLEAQYRACGKLRAYIHSLPYDEWIPRFDRLTDRDRRRIRRRIAKMQNPPRFALVVHGDGESVSQTMRSLEAQLYRNFSVVAPGAALDAASYVSVLQAGDRLAEHALYWAAEAIAGGQNIAMAYADDDEIDAHGTRSRPRFKPDWSPEHLRSINYPGRWVLFRAAELASAGGIRAESLAGNGHELNLRVAAALGRAQVAHIPAVLYHRATPTPPDEPAPRARYAVPGNSPLVTIVIPTRDQETMLRNCIESIERASTYRHYEILVVDNRSTSGEALSYLASLTHRVLRYEHEFNYSAINNHAVQAARGEVVVLLNNDTEVISADWLEEMLGHLHQEGVAVVGAKLLYADGRVQHAGVAVGPGGCADHMHLGIERDAPGYCYRALVAHEVSAVTGACLMTWRSLYQRLGGLDEKELAVSFNDVDYCLRVLEAGKRVIFTPHAHLYHLESASRGRGRSPDAQARETGEANVMRRRWRERLQHDPYYNPNLSYRFPDFSLSDAPRVKKPWLR